MFATNIYLAFILFTCGVNNLSASSGKPKPVEAADTLQNEIPYDDQQFKHPRPQPDGKPNIVIILVDDMGFNDVSFHGSNQILTPNIDALAYNGIILNRHYVPNLCTPSRATLLTGKNPIHTGTHHFVIINDEPWGLPLSETLMPEYFRDAGYSTNLVGKWHLGFWRKELTPTMRGFDHHFGYYSGYIGYYDHVLKMLNRNYSAGLDFRRDLLPWREATGLYATEVFTTEGERIIREHDATRPLFLVMSHLAVHTGNEDNPMEAPEEEVQKFPHIADKKRRIYAGMISSLDRSVGKTVRALADKGLLNNTIILFASDNGAPTVGIHSNAGSNYPLRGIKETPWEGGIRSAAAIWSPLLKTRGYVSNQVVHASDWLPTLASAAGIKLPRSKKLDGINLWNTLSQNTKRKPRRLLHVYDNIVGYSAYTRDNLKLVNGSQGSVQFNDWLGVLPSNEVDPAAASYAQAILSSEVQSTIAEGELSVNQIESLRAQATTSCRKHVKDFSNCDPKKAPCLFDIFKDPCERHNLAAKQPAKVKALFREMTYYAKSIVPSARVPRSDPACDPALHNGTWEWWYKADPEQYSTSVSGDERTWLGPSLWGAEGRNFPGKRLDLHFEGI